MKSLMAIVTPQEVVNGCIDAVECVTHQHGLPPLPGGELDHFGFVVSREEFSRLTESFVSSVVDARTHLMPEAGWARVGMQAPSSNLSWYYGNVIPAITLVQGAEGFSVPVGGGYVVVTFKSMTHAVRTLNRLGIPYEETTLYGSRALRVEGNGHDYSVGPGVYSLYVMTDDLASIAGI